jgi:methyl-accepting chemotaxis protein
MTVTRLIDLYGRGLRYASPLLLGAVLAADTRWTGQLLEVLLLTVCSVGLRGAQIALTKYSYLTQIGLPALTGSLLVGLPATALAVGVGTLCADWVWQRKAFRAALINAGREVVALVAAFGVYAVLVRALHLTPSGLHVELLLPLFAYAMAYFAFTRILFYFSLILRGKLERSERMFILRYECIGYGATIVAGGTIVATVVAWPAEAWGIVGVLVAFLGLLFKGMLEEAISAEELNKVHAMEAVITSNIRLEDAFARIETLAHRLVDWGDFRIYRRQEGELRLAYRGAIGWQVRSEPSSDTAALRAHVERSGQTVSIEDVGRDQRVADAPLMVQSLVIVPLKFGDQVIGTLELEHHKRKTYRAKDLSMITTFANQLATAIHITELRRPLVETVERLTQQLATLARAAEALREAAGAVAASTRAIREGVVSEEGEVSGGLEATESLAQASRRVSEDGAEAAQASSAASEVAHQNRRQIRDAIERLVALKVQGLGQLSRRITGFIASIRELADMTNLLALNAAIEAARAGKHGKGFAVVAEEVRRLAEQSGSAAEEAGGLVQDVHREVGEVVEQMRRGQVTVGGVEDLSAAALEALDAIVAATALATAHAKRIAGAAQEQDQAFGTLRRRIHAVAAIASRNRTEAADVATRASEAAQGVSDLERATRELEKVATMLRELTRGFASVA